MSNWLVRWIREGRELRIQSEQTRAEIARLLALMANSQPAPTCSKPGSNEGPGRWIDLDRVIAVKWDDKVIDPTEVVYVLRETS